MLIAGAVSEPLLIAVFRQEVALQMEKDDLAERDAAADRLRDRNAVETARLDDADRALQDRLSQLDSLVDDAYKSAAAEADRVAGTMMRGRGPR